MLPFILAIFLWLPLPAAADEATNADLAFRMGDYRRAEQIARPLAEKGDPRAQYLLGQLYAKGLGLAPNPYEAARWFRRAAEQGDPESQAALGQSYEYGRGVSRNYAEAARWYRLAADRGQVEAQFLLGRMYERGYGVGQDNVLAYVWFTLAANNTAPSPRPQDVEARRVAAQRRTTVAFRMTPDQIADADELIKAWQPVQSQ
jgi:TPR repeat protein